MVVNYNPRLINLVKEVRLLSLKGYTIPSEIKDTAKQASKFSTQALSLSQVSSYKHLYAPEKLEVIWKFLDFFEIFTHAFMVLEMKITGYFF